MAVGPVPESLGTVASCFAESWPLQFRETAHKPPGRGIRARADTTSPVSQFAPKAHLLQGTVFGTTSRSGSSSTATDLNTVRIG